MLICANCKKEFSSLYRKDQICCSKKCKAELRHKLTLKINQERKNEKLVDKNYICWELDVDTDMERRVYYNYDEEGNVVTTYGEWQE